MCSSAGWMGARCVSPQTSVYVAVYVAAAHRELRQRGASNFVAAMWMCDELQLQVVDIRSQVDVM